METLLHMLLHFFNDLGPFLLDEVDVLLLVDFILVALHLVLYLLEGIGGQRPEFLLDLFLDRFVEFPDLHLRHILHFRLFVFRLLPHYNQMEQKSNDYRTMYLKFPTVTKVQYPIELVSEHTNMRSTQAITFRQNFMRKTQVKLDLIRGAADCFKIIQLPERNQIMNICTMTVKNKERVESPAQEEAKKKVYSVTKLNTFSVKPEGKSEQQTITLKNPFKMRSGSIKDLRKVSLPPTVNFDCFEIYPQIAALLALSFGVIVSSESQQRLRKARVELSNNGHLVKQTLKKRIWWVIGKEEAEAKNNLIWSPQILPKRQLQRALQANNECFHTATIQEQEKLVFQRSFDKILNQLPKIKQLLFTEWQQQPTRLKDWLTRLQQDQLSTLSPDDLIINNHIPNHTQITNKKLLYKNMVQYYRSIDVDPNTKLPKTHHITCFNWQDIVKQLKTEEKIWIMKPGEFTNRGNGILIFRNTKEALDEILLSPPKTEERSLLLQEYISPMLYQQRKFDIRCYMLGIQVNNCLKFYWYQQGYIRTASQKFTTRKVSRSIHLTNDAVQKHMPNYDRFESANKLSYNELDKYCLNQTTFNFYQEILPEMKKMARDIAHAVGDTRIIGAGKGLSFQIYGLDFLVDEFGKPWLCEVNTNPSLQICCSLLSRIIPELLDNTFRLVLDIFLPSKKTPESAQSFLTSNKYSLLYSHKH